MTRGLKTGLWILVAAVIVAIFAITAMRRLARQEVRSIESIQAAEGVPVDLVVVPAVHLEDWREFVGICEGHEQVSLSADFRTRIDAVHVAVGDEVAAGEVLVSLDDYDPGRAMLNLSTTRSQYETARADSLRMEELLRSGAISQQELDHVRTQCQAARAAYLSARRAVELDTPIAGIVTALNAEPGEYAEGEQTLATVAAYDRVRIPLDVSDAERRLIEVGQQVRVRPSHASSENRSTAEGGYLHGEVVKAALSADSQTRLFRVELIVDNRGRALRPGSLVTPEIRIAVADGVPAVPTVALRRINGAEQIFVVSGPADELRAELRQVDRGVTDGRLVEIGGDLTPGERVVVWGQEKLEEGARVKVNRDRTADYYSATR